MSVETAPSRRRFMQASGALGLAADPDIQRIFLGA